MVEENHTLPKDWDEAHPVLETWYGEVLGLRSELEARTAERVAVIESLRAHVDTRFDEQAERMRDLETSHDEILRGVNRLHSVFTDTAEKYSVLLNSYSTKIQEDHEHWITFEDEQKKMAANIALGVKIVCREDKWRNFFRVATLITGFVILFAILIDKVR